MTRPSKEKPVSQALQLQGKATEIIRRIDTPEKAAEFFVNTREAYDAVGDVMRHVRGMLILEAKERTIPVGASFVSAEPNEYTYDIAAVKELAKDCIVMKEVPTSDKMKRIHELAGNLLTVVLENAITTITDDDWALFVSNLEEIVKQSQPEMLEAVDANKLRGVLGRGDARAQALMDRRVKTPVGWKLVIREGADASR